MPCCCGAIGNNPVTVDAEEIRNLKKAVEDLQNTVGQPAPAAAPEVAKKPKTLKEDTDDVSADRVATAWLIGEGREVA